MVTICVISFGILSSASIFGNSSYTKLNANKTASVRKLSDTIETEEIDMDLGLRERDTIIFNDDIDVRIETDVEITDYEEQPLDIFKEMEKKDALDALLDNYTIDDSYKEEVESEMEESKTLVEEELNRNYDNYEKELEQSYKEDLNDSDLFNLIDSMYSNGDGE